MMNRAYELLFCLFALGLVLLGRWAARDPESPLKEVHEWGTMTSVAGSDGRQFAWWRLNPFSEKKDIPSFVETNPLGGKDSVDYIQRMETPVLYFYPDRPIQVKIRVSFSKGRITEFFPSDGLVLTGRPTLEKVSGPIDWTLDLFPPDSAKAALIPPVGDEGDHYQFARDVPEAWLVQRRVSKKESEFQSISDRKIPGLEEVEKFLFYRGAADVSTPLFIQSSEENRLHCLNLLDPKLYGEDPISASWVLRVSGGKAAWKRLPPFVLDNPAYSSTGFPSVDVEIPVLPSAGEVSNLEAVARDLREEMLPALVKAGLNEAEAKAMLNTWDDTWFKDPGTRVLYILPQQWVDSVLPLTIKPKPQKMERVFVARVEVLSPSTEKALLGITDKAQTTTDFSDLIKRSKELELGRFLGAGLQRAIDIREEQLRSAVLRFQQEMQEKEATR